GHADTVVPLDVRAQELECPCLDHRPRVPRRRAVAAAGLSVIADPFGSRVSCGSDERHLTLWGGQAAGADAAPGRAQTRGSPSEPPSLRPCWLRDGGQAGPGEVGPAWRGVVLSTSDDGTIDDQRGLDDCHLPGCLGLFDLSV